MILADKIIRLRKKNGWSQEELADRMQVSRQAVSKWEAAQTTPDLEKILQLSRLFGVTTDYLLKDEQEREEFTADADDLPPVRRVTLEDANAYLAQRQWASGRIALAVLLCILSPICLLILGALAEQPAFGVSETVSSTVGLAVLLGLVAVAVTAFLYVGAKNSPYTFLESEAFELAYGVSGMVKERQEQYRSTYIRGNITGVCLCILAPIPLIFGSFTPNEVILTLCLSLMLAAVGAGVLCFVTVGVRWAAMERLLREGEFAPKKQESLLSETVSTVYWCVVLAVYLGWSFSSHAWGTTWVVWPIAGVLSAALTVILRLVEDKNGKK